MATDTTKLLVDTFLQACKNTHFITQPHDVMLMVLTEIADNLNKLDTVSINVTEAWEQAAKEADYPHIQAVARAFLENEKATRLTAFATIMSQHTGRTLLGWIDLNPSRQFVELLGDASAIRCGFGFSAMPALVAAFDAKQANRTCQVRFVDTNQAQSELVQLASIAIGVDVEVVVEHPFMRIDEGNFDAELCFPPFGKEFTRRDALPFITLDVMGAPEKGRLQYEGVAIADALVHANKRKVVLVHSAGLLFRSVGIEALMRLELIESGRLSSVLAVPPGMVFLTTGIKAAVLTLEPDSNTKRPVRFVDLADDALSKQAPRGRSDMRDDVTWQETICKKLQGDEPWARDIRVGEIKQTNGLLDVGRYLQSEKTQAFVSYLSTKNTRLLIDLVTFQRPRSLRKSDDSDIVIREASPSDIQETGYLAPPARKMHITRGDLQHARNQVLSEGDMVISIKGTIGLVGIVPDSAPDVNDDEFWTAGQSLLILKVRGDSTIETLYEYLTNDIVQSHLASLGSGTTVPMLHTKELKSLQVPILTDKEHRAVKKAFCARQERFEAIDALRAKIVHERAKCWPHNELNGNSGQ